MSWLIVSCDGTWNTPDMASVTNVRRLHNLLDETATQRTFYASGVGTTGSLIDRVDAGMVGDDLDAKILDAYRWLVTRYVPGDEIALFGFSRGAYTVRSLAGLIGACGLVDPRGLAAADLEQRIRRVYDEGYRGSEPGWRNGLRFRYDSDDQEYIPVRFIGVWDTVGAHGIPENLGGVRPHERARRTFRTLDLDARIPVARHAVALDEMRGPFAPTLWNSVPEGSAQDVVQVWFAGSHMDVGGGHPERGLADITLEWMLSEVRSATTIGVADPKSQISPDPLDVVHDDNHHLLGPGLSLALDATVDRLTEWIWDSRPRRIPRLDESRPSPEVHASVYERQRGRPITSGRYRPTTVLAAPGDTATADVAAEAPWNETGLYLEPGLYDFAAAGAWRDGHAWTDPNGTRAPALGLLKGVGGSASRVLRVAADLWTRRRHPEWTLIGEPRRLGLGWMRLVGVVANDAAPRSPEAPPAHQVLDVGAMRRERIVAPGYLYAYANDAWGSYVDNVGSVRITVTFRAR